MPGIPRKHTEECAGPVGACVISEVCVSVNVRFVEGLVSFITAATNDYLHYQIMC